MLQTEDAALQAPKFVSSLPCASVVVERASLSGTSRLIDPGRHGSKRSTAGD